MCSVPPYTFNFFYSSLYFLLKHIILSYSEFNTVSRLYGSDPCSALHFPGASLIMQSHNSLHLRACRRSTSRRDYQTVQPIILSYIRKKQNQLMCTLSSFPPTQTFSQTLPHTHTRGPVPRSTYMSLLMQQNEETGWRESEEEV